MPAAPDSNVQVKQRFDSVLRVDQRAAVGQRGLHIEDDGQRLVVDIDRFERVLRRGLVAGDDDGHGLAHVVHLVDGDARVAWIHDVGRDRPRARNAALRFGEILSGEHRDDAGPTDCRRCVDRGDPRMGERTPQDREMQQPGQSDVVRPEGPAGDEVRILLTAARLADLRGRWTFLEGGHRATPAVCSESAMVRAADWTARTMF